MTAAIPTAAAADSPPVPSHKLVVQRTQEVARSILAPSGGGTRLRGGQVIHRCSDAGSVTVLLLALGGSDAHATGAPAPAVALAAQPVVAIPRLSAASVVVPVGLEPDGTMEAPTFPDTVGWYAPGAALGVPGNAILAGHVDWGGRLRTFGLLKQLEPGDRVHLSDALGRWLTYQVVWNRTVDAEGAPVDEIFAQGPNEELTLVTCGGTFDAATRQYLSRVVVRALRVPTD